jgi:tripeptidyl-peptidase I
MTFLSLLSFALLVTAKPVGKKFDYAVKERHPPPRKWMVKGDAPGEAMLRLHIGLKMDSWSQLEKELYEGTWTQHT